MEGGAGVFFCSIFEDLRHSGSRALLNSVEKGGKEGSEISSPDFSLYLPRRMKEEDFLPHFFWENDCRFQLGKGSVLSVVGMEGGCSGAAIKKVIKEALSKAGSF